MPKPRAEDRSTLNELTMTLKVSPAFREKLAWLVEARTAEALKAFGQRVPISASATLRWLVERECETRGYGAPKVSPAAEPPPEPPAQAAPEARRKRARPRQSAPTPQSLRAALERRIASGEVTLAGVARKSGIGRAMLRRFVESARGISARQLAALQNVLGPK